ncbi:MAG: hypothetical protein F6K40_15950 [Okeania sp. SIO3I5]|uniref:hypothetical protein n=1 Tax=Okeania sp. SIO3I5 TaxID=2607805 RepID=UPI0013B8C79C|nr:hypothetical protein [Okeania sp. SIO3I5]NEQ37676.1 hypothetical protein [Okeania sp. SIO3I5]
MGKKPNSPTPELSPLTPQSQAIPDQELLKPLWEGGEDGEGGEEGEEEFCLHS